MRNERPLQFFGLVGAALDFNRGGARGSACRDLFRDRISAAAADGLVLAIGLIILGFLSFLAGLILDVVATMRSEIKRLTYLSYPPVSAGRN